MFVYIADLALDRRPRDRQIDLALSLWCPAILTLHETYRMSTTRTNVAEAAPKDILQDERLKLWVCSGGRCAICNAYLLADEFTGHYVNLAEMAHNVGRQRASGSPRGTDELAIQERNKAENLLLLCRKDHKVIDHPDTRAEWPVERLREIKRTHEDRIYYLTGLGEDSETVVLRAIGAIRGGKAVEVSKETVRRAVRASARYPRYELGTRSGSDIELDLTALPGEGEPTYWQVAEQMITDTVAGQVSDGVRRGHIRHLSVFALARIALLVLLGHHLEDKLYVELYQRQRDDAMGWGWDEDSEPVAFETRAVTPAGGESAVTLLCSLSGTINPNELPTEIVQASAVYEIRPSTADAGPEILRSRTTLRNFASTYREFLAAVETAHPDATAINLVAAVPVTAAIELGRARMRNVHPPLRVYERAEAGYALAVEVGP
jgi:hypothetical protein